MAEELATATWVTRALAHEDAPAMRALFAEVFGKPMSQTFWNWKYANPSGHGTGVWKGGELVAHYGGMGRDMLYFGEPRRAVQITDVMVKIAGRASVRRNSPFYLAGKAFLETWIGYEQPYLLGFGFPSDRHMALANHLGLYAPVGRMVETRWATAGARRSPWLSVLDLSAGLPDVDPAAVHHRVPSSARSEAAASKNAGGILSERPSSPPNSRTSPLPGFPAAHAIDQLWQNMAADLAAHIVPVKNAAFLEQRYVHHPEHAYSLHLVRRRLTRRPLGLIVLRHEADHCLLMDAVGPLAYLPALLAAAIGQSVLAGKPELKTWCCRAFAPLFDVHGATQQELPITTPTNILTPAPAPETLQDKWWLMPGDTDFL